MSTTDEIQSQMEAYMAENTGGNSVCTDGASTDGSSSGWAVQSAKDGSVCYEQIHPDSYNVFDFSYFRCAQRCAIVTLPGWCTASSRPSRFALTPLYPPTLAAAYM